MNGNYYNTTNQTGDTLKQSWESNRTQTQIVLEYFESHPCETLGASEVWERLIASKQISPKVPLTSIRRAITDLCSESKLIKSEVQKIGMFTKPEHCWFLNCPVGQLALL